MSDLSYERTDEQLKQVSGVVYWPTSLQDDFLHFNCFALRIHDVDKV
jgi:hypothetical protein